VKQAILMVITPSYYLPTLAAMELQNRVVICSPSRLINSWDVHNGLDCPYSYPVYTYITHHMNIVFDGFFGLSVYQKTCNL